MYKLLRLVVSGQIIYGNSKGSFKLILTLRLTFTLSGRLNYVCINVNICVVNER